MNAGKFSWTPKHAGAALSWPVGMLTVGTALPHLLRGANCRECHGNGQMLAASVFALVGGGAGLVLVMAPIFRKRPWWYAAS